MQRFLLHLLQTVVEAVSDRRAPSWELSEGGKTGANAVPR